MVENQSARQSAAPAGPLPFETFLATQDPVWVWDSQARRIVWANTAAAAFWGEGDQERLTRRRLARNNTGLTRLKELGDGADPLDRTETLSLPTANGETVARCYIQRLELTGGRAGLVVRILPSSDRPQCHDARPGHKPRPPTPAKTQKDKTQKDKTQKKLGSKANTPKKSLRPPAKVKPASTARPAPPPSAWEPHELPEEELPSLLSQASHELRNPLTIIMGFAEIIRDDRLGNRTAEHSRDYARDIYSMAQLALSLADDLLLYAEQNEHRQIPHKAALEINAIAEECLRLVGPLAAKQQLALSHRLMRKTEPFIIGDERSIRQMLLNLLINAVRYSGRGGKVSVTTRAAQGGGLIVTIKDSGPGISKADLVRLTEPLAEQNTVRRGLGLRLAAAFARSNGARLSIASQIGVGTRVQITFPASCLAQGVASDKQDGKEATSGGGIRPEVSGNLARKKKALPGKGAADKAGGKGIASKKKTARRPKLASSAR